MELTNNGNRGTTDFSTLTYKEFKALLPSTAGQNLPTMKALSMIQPDVFVRLETKDGLLTVFSNGFFSYEMMNGNATVYAVDRCSRIVLNPALDGGLDALDKWSFGDQPWTKVLEFAATERIVGNISRNAERHEVLSIDADPDYWNTQMSVLPDFEMRLEEEAEKEQETQLLEMAKGVLTARQWEVLYLYYGKELTQEKIANALNIPQSSVSITLKRGLQNLRRKIQAIK